MFEDQGDVASERRVGVIVVHGTADAVLMDRDDRKWWQTESVFARRLVKRLRQLDELERSNADVDQRPRDFAIIPFHWSGDNKKDERQIASGELADQIREICGADGPTEFEDIHIVAHSHGGNVLLEALLESVGDGLDEFVSIKPYYDDRTNRDFALFDIATEIEPVEGIKSDRTSQVDRLDYLDVVRERHAFAKKIRSWITVGTPFFNYDSKEALIRLFDWQKNPFVAPNGHLLKDVAHFFDKFSLRRETPSQRQAIQDLGGRAQYRRAIKEYRGKARANSKISAFTLSLLTIPLAAGSAMFVLATFLANFILPTGALEELIRLIIGAINAGADPAASATYALSNSPATSLGPVPILAYFMALFLSLYLALLISLLTLRYVRFALFKKTASPMSNVSAGIGIRTSVESGAKFGGIFQVRDDIHEPDRDAFARHTRWRYLMLKNLLGSKWVNLYSKYDEAIRFLERADGGSPVADLSHAFEDTPTYLRLSVQFILSLILCSAVFGFCVGVAIPALGFIHDPVFELNFLNLSQPRNLTLTWMLTLGVFCILAACFYVSGRFIRTFTMFVFDRVNLITRTAQYGDNTSFGRIKSVSSVPYALHVDLPSDPLPDEIDKEIVDLAGQDGFDWAEKVREALLGSGKVAGSNSFIEALSREFHFRSLIHTSYFRSPKFVDLVATAMMREDLLSAGIDDGELADHHPDVRRTLNWLRGIRTSYASRKPKFEKSNIAFQRPMMRKRLW